jgi:Tol biopolymer transport system component
MKSRTALAALTVTCAFTVAVSAGAGTAVVPRGQLELVSVSSSGQQGNGDSQSAAISPNGRFVAFASQANNLVPGDTNFSFDVFLRDRRNGTTERVSVGPLGVEGDDNSGLGSFSDGPALSADGRFVAFSSGATNFAPAGTDTNQNQDVFVRDRLTGTTELISVGLDGKAAQGTDPSISTDGRFVAFTSFGDTLVPGDDNFASDIFVRDRRNGTTERVSVDSNGNQVSGESFTPALSADGRFVAFDSFSGNLVAGDKNDSVDVFVHDRRTGATEGISTRTSCDPTIGDICGNSLLSSITPNGRFVGFNSPQQNLVPHDTDFFQDAFVVDRQTNSIRLLSRSSSGAKGNDDSVAPLLRFDGREAVFSSRASNLVRGDNNQQQDVFDRDRADGETERIAADRSGQFPVVADDMTPDAMDVALETRAALRPEQDVGSFALDIYILRNG